MAEKGDSLFLDNRSRVHCCLKLYYSAAIDDSKEEGLCSLYNKLWTFLVSLAVCRLDCSSTVI